MWDKSERINGTFSRSEFIFDAGSNTYTCPGGKILQQYRRPFTMPRTGIAKENTRLYRASKTDCAACVLKANCCPGQPARKVPRSVHEAARDVVRGLANSPEYVHSRRERKKVEMLFALISSAFSGSIGSDCAVHQVPKTSFCSPRSPRTCVSLLSRSNRSRLAPCPWEHSRNELKARTSEPPSADSPAVTRVTEHSRSPPTWPKSFPRRLLQRNRSQNGHSRFGHPTASFAPKPTVTAVPKIRRVGSRAAEFRTCTGES